MKQNQVNDFIVSGVKMQSTISILAQLRGHCRSANCAKYAKVYFPKVDFQKLS